MPGSFKTDFLWEFTWDAVDMKLLPLELELFARSPFSLERPFVFAIFRTLSFILMLEIVLHSLAVTIKRGNGAWWLIYITHISAFIEVIYLGFAASTTWIYGSLPFVIDAADSVGFSGINFRTSRTPHDRAKIRPPCLMLGTWILQNLAFSSSLAVFLLYWLLVYDCRSVSWTNAGLHGINFIILSIDIFVSGSQYRLSHFYQPFILGILYMIFTFIHVAARLDNGNVDGIYIYDILDYDQDSSAYAIVIILTFIGTPILYCLTWLIYWLGRTTAQHVIGKASLGGGASSGGEAALQHTMALV